MRQRVRGLDPGVLIRGRCALSRIAIVSLGGTYPFRIGGPSLVAYHLVRQMDQKGIRVDFVFGISGDDYRHRDAKSSFAFSNNVKLIPIVKNPKCPRSDSTPFDLALILRSP